jgi:type IV secretion system protein TrbD
MVLFSGLLASALIFTAQAWKATAYGIALWTFAVFVLRLMAKHDPKLRQVYMRHRLYAGYYPARSTAWRDNTRTQEKQYK